jgi:hypothetical protein
MVSEETRNLGVLFTSVLKQLSELGSNFAEWRASKKKGRLAKQQHTSQGSSGW